jgi:hypothetical protein
VEPEPLIINHQFVILSAGPQSREIDCIEKPRALVSGPTFLNNSPAPAIGTPEKTTEIVDPWSVSAKT